MKAGDAVEVKRQYPADLSFGWPALTTWVDGYVFVREGVVRHTRGTFAGMEVNYPPEDIRAERPSRVTFKVELSNKVARGQAVGNLYGVGRFVNDCRTFYALDPQPSQEVAHAFAAKWNAIAACPFLNTGEACTCGHANTRHGDALLAVKGAQR